MHPYQTASTPMVCDMMRRRTAAGDRVDTCWTAYLGFQPVNLEEATAADFISWLKSFVVVRELHNTEIQYPMCFSVAVERRRKLRNRPQQSGESIRAAKILVRTRRRPSASREAARERGVYRHRAPCSRDASGAAPARRVPFNARRFLSGLQLALPSRCGCAEGCGVRVHQASLAARTRATGGGRGPGDRRQFGHSHVPGED